MNELMLIVSVVFIYGATLAAYALFGRSGLYCISALTTVFANIEVIILIKAFGLEQTLGNVLFASTFLATDILSECEGKKSANKAVYIGIFANVFFLILSQMWFAFEPSVDDTAMPAIRAIFSQTPRLVAASLIVYAVSQFFDVWLYHKWWTFTEKRFGDKRKFLWLRNSGFAGTYDALTVLSIFGSGYIIFIFTTLLDTPIVYLARRFHDKKLARGELLLTARGE